MDEHCPCFWAESALDAAMEPRQARIRDVEIVVRVSTDAELRTAYFHTLQRLAIHRFEDGPAVPSSPRSTMLLLLLLNGFRQACLHVPSFHADGTSGVLLL